MSRSQPDLFGGKTAETRDRTRVTLELVWLDETPKAWLVAKDALAPGAWLPKSQADRSDNFPNEFSMERWIAQEKGLI